ncbi:MAG: hemerythrin domain-containing protein [Planctomycetes bacterium]|nr:hemerythrin domain-containing protein [Planctomycetota bacterium]
MIKNKSTYSRRHVVTGAGAALVLGQANWAAETGRSMVPKDVLTPMEDLTRQHAVARRVLMVYRLNATGELGVPPMPMQSVTIAATILRSVLEDFHAKFEEDNVFPLFGKADQWTDLVSTLRDQHAVARRLTDSILQATRNTTASAPTEALARNLMAYTRMIEAHTAYEETLLYPQIRTVASEADYEQLWKALQDAERRKFGPEGVAGVLNKVVDVERSAGIMGLAQFTPKTGEPVARETTTP